MLPKRPPRWLRRRTWKDTLGVRKVRRFKRSVHRARNK